MDTTALIAARDKLNADIGQLIGVTTVDQATVDKLTADTTALDAEVVAALVPPPPPPPPPPPAQDFTAFNAAVAAFVADKKVTQVEIDALTNAVIGSTV